MGKTKKMKPSQMANKVPLELEIQNACIAKSKDRNKIRLRQDEDEKVVYTLDSYLTCLYKRLLFFQFVSSNLSKKILSAARQQQREIEGLDTPAETSKSPFKVPKLTTGDDSESDNEEEEDTLEPDTFFENIEISEADEKSMEMFMSRNPLPRRTLADIIMEKITEKHTELDTQFSDIGSTQIQDIDPRVKQMYEGVRDVLKKYRSGKLPKAFKIVPKLRNWEQILFITGKKVEIINFHFGF